MKEPLFIVIDLFCGAGGTTTGFALAELEGKGIAKVIGCVNHDKKAIKSHWWNHPDVKHFEEDIRTLDLTELIKLVQYYRNKYPNALLILWASLECTNFSKAKGGQPRDADSRTLADHLERYIVALNPDYIQIENVVEFMSWGPLDEKGKPVSRKNGQDWMRWRKLICSHGYRDEWRELNSANYGAYTSRNRLFGVFAKPYLPIAFPEPTHAKKVDINRPIGAYYQDSFGHVKQLETWKAVKEVLDFSDEGESIFTRNKPLSDKTLERIYAGLIKYVAKGDTAFISKYFSGRPKGKVNSVNEPGSTVTTFAANTLVQTKNFSDLSIEQPAGAITCKDHHAIVQTVPVSLLKYDSTDKDGTHYPPSLENPCPTIITQSRLGLVQGQFLVDNQWSTRNGTAAKSLDDPCHVITTRDATSVVQPCFLMKYYSGDPNGKVSSVSDPAHTIRTKDGQALVQPQFLALYYTDGGQHSSIENPAPTIPTKDRISIISPEFLTIYNGKSLNRSVDEPAPVVPCNDRLGLVQPEYFIDKHYNAAQNQSVDQPAGTVMPNDKHRLVECVPFIMPTNYDNVPKSIDEPAPTITAGRRHHYIVNPSHGGHSTSTENPCPVIVARQDKVPLYLVQVENGPVAISVYECDSEPMIRIKQFMAVYSLVDIKMRMLRVKELLKIQGFPAEYKLDGNQADQKKFIGNSVVPHVVKAWTEAMAVKIIDTQNQKVA